MLASDSLNVTIPVGSRSVAASSQLLAAHPLFEGAKHEPIAPLIARAVIRTIAKGTLLHFPDDRNDPMYLLLRGRLRAYQLTTDGRRLLLDIILPGGFDGLLPMLGKRGHFTEAAEESVVACLEWRLLQQFFDADPRILRNLVEMVAERLQGREQQLESMIIRNPTRRLARQLSALTAALGQRAGDGRMALPRTITHQLLADMLGIRRETVTLHLPELIKLGAVEAGRRPLVVHPSRLEAIASSR